MNALPADRGASWVASATAVLVSTALLVAAVLFSG